MVPKYRSKKILYLQCIPNWYRQFETLFLSKEMRKKDIFVVFYFLNFFKPVYVQNVTSSEFSVTNSYSVCALSVVSRLFPSKKLSFK